MTLVWSYGGGTQSAAIAVLVLQGRLPRPDMVVMADTSRERQATWDYLAEVAGPGLASIGLTVEVASHDLATVDMFAQNGDLLLPAFTRQNGATGKLPTFCSDKWKKAVIHRYLRSRGIEDCDVWIGMSVDELERMKPSGLLWYRHVWPLIDLRINRANCVALVEAFGWPTPPKSRCWMCPNMAPREWQRMKREEPGEFAQAVALEKQIRARDPDAYLHPLALPLEQAVRQHTAVGQRDMFDGCDSGYCWT